MDDKLTENEEVQEVVAKPIFTVREREKEETAEATTLSEQSTDSVAMDGTEVELEVEKPQLTKNNESSKLQKEGEKEEKNDKQKTEEVKAAKIIEEEKALKNAIEEQAREDEQPLSSNFTLKKILGGDIFSAHFLRNNIGLIVLIVVFVIIYISNRYSVQKDLIEIDKLETELSDAKYRALSSSSQLTERSRESHVLEILKTNKDSILKISSRPPFIINVPSK